MGPKSDDIVVLNNHTKKKKTYLKQARRARITFYKAKSYIYLRPGKFKTSES
jgi:hypothetical protein